MKSSQSIKTVRIAVALALTFVLQIAVSAQGQMASPRKSAEITLNGKKISLDYGAPSARGRKIVGGLVPYDKVWRLGANKATHLTTEADLIVGGVAVPKGTYTLFALPSEKGWKLIVSKQTGQWGTNYDQSQDLARIDMKVSATKAPVEMMTLSLEPAGKGGVLKMEWENTSASVNISAK